MIKDRILYIKTTIIYRDNMKSDMFTPKKRLLVSKSLIQYSKVNLLKYNHLLGENQVSGQS